MKLQTLELHKTVKYMHIATVQNHLKEKDQCIELSLHQFQLKEKDKFLALRRIYNIMKNAFQFLFNFNHII